MKRNNDFQSKTFTTLDAYLSGYLTLRGFIPKLIEQGPKVVFSFEASDNLYQVITDYNNGATIEASRLALAIKTLKSQIFSLRKNKESGYDSKATTEGIR